MSYLIIEAKGRTGYEDLDKPVSLAKILEVAGEPKDSGVLEYTYDLVTGTGNITTQYGQVPFMVREAQGFNFTLSTEHHARRNS